MFRAFGVPVFDADAEVHALFAPGGAAVAPVAAAFPGCLRRRRRDRPRPCSAAWCWAARTSCAGSRPSSIRWCAPPKAASCAAPAGRRAELVVLDIPLLLETGGEGRVDAVAVVCASPMLQAQRALRRPGMTAERSWPQIRAEQLPDPEKRRRADFVIPPATTAARWPACRPVIAALRGARRALAAAPGSRRLIGHLGQGQLPSASRSKVNQRARPRRTRAAPPCGVEAVVDLEDHLDRPVGIRCASSSIRSIWPRPQS